MAKVDEQNTVRISDRPDEETSEGAVDLKTALQEANERLATDLKTASERLAELRQQNSDLGNALKAREGEVMNLKDYIARIDEKAEIAYDLEPISKGNPCSRYDGMQEDGVFIWHEAMHFTTDSGYDRSVIYDRAKASIDRAVGSGYMLGKEQVERIAPDCFNLPPFDSRNAIEVIVRIIPK